MKIKPIYKRASSAYNGNELPPVLVGAMLELSVDDAMELAQIIAYARHLQDDDNVRTRRLVAQLGAVAEALNGDAQAEVQQDATYVRTRSLLERR